MARSKQVRMMAAMAVLALGFPAASLAQQKQGKQGKDPRVNPPVAPAGESTSRAPETALATPEPVPAAAPQADQRPLTGVEELSLGMMNQGRSFLVPSLRISQGLHTDTGNAASGTWRHRTNVNGSLQLQRSWSRYVLSTSYTTGGMIFSSGNRSANMIHSLALSQSIVGRRWTFTLSDSFSYLPESAFGLNGFGNIAGIGQLPGGFGSPGFNQGLINPGLLPNQSILTQDANRVSNMVVGQLAYVVSPRVSWNVSGGYGFLRFLDGGFTNSSNTMFRTGINYQLRGTDSIGVTYGYGSTGFEGLAQGTRSHTAQMFYGRQVTGRIALRVGAGPSVNLFQNPLAGSGHRMTWRVNSTLNYALENSNLSVSYFRTVSNGSGVLTGAETDAVSGSISRQLSRMWSGGLSLGYARNASLRELNPGLFSNLTFNSYRAGLSFSRPVARSGNFFAAYQLSYQNLGACASGATATCPGRVLRHAISLGFDWQFNPITLE